MRRFASPSLLSLAAAALCSTSCALLVGFEDNQLDPGAQTGSRAPIAERLLWAVQIGGEGDDTAQSATVDAEGNVFVIGLMSGSIDLGGAPLSAGFDTGAYVAKFDPDGNHLWSRAFSMYLTDLPGGQPLATDGAGDALLGVSYEGSIDLGGGPLPEQTSGLAAAKLAGAEGGHVWSQGHGNEFGCDIDHVAVDGQGAVLVAGWFGDVLDLGGGPIGSADNEGNAFVAKLDASGNHVFTLEIAGSECDDVLVECDEAGGLAADAAGNVVVAGVFGGTLTVGGSAAPSPSPSQGGGLDIFVAKVSPTGAPLWTKTFGSPGSDRPSQVALDAQGNIYLTGKFSGAIDFGGDPLIAQGSQTDVFLAKLDPEGNHLYSRSFGDADDQEAASVAVDGAGNVLLTGTFLGELNFDGVKLKSEGGGELLGGDVFLAKLDPSSNTVWSYRIGDGDDQTGHGVAVDGQGNVFAVGEFAGTVDLGDGPRASRGYLDGYLIKLSP